MIFRLLKYLKNRLLKYYLKLLSYFIISFEFIEYFNNKDVVIIGPNTVYDTSLINEVTNSDVIVFINKGYRLSFFKEIKKKAKEVVLFHCLDQSEVSGGGKFNSLQLRALGIKKIFYPLHLPNSEIFVKKFLLKNFFILKLYQIEKHYYQKLEDKLNGFRPNTGFAAIYLISKAKNVSLYITGINFMRNNYINNYRSFSNIDSVIKFIEKAGNHNPDEDLLLFYELYKNGNIKVDNELKKILQMPFKRLFYINDNLLSTNN